MPLTLKDLKPRMNIIDDETFDADLEALISWSVESLETFIGSDIDLDDPEIIQLQQLMILGEWDERQTQYRNYINTKLCTLQAKYRLKREEGY
ncbi:MAG: head-tail connector protein [Bacilli bacterium]